MHFGPESACWRITNSDLGTVSAADRREGRWVTAGPRSERKAPQRVTHLPLKVTDLWQDVDLALPLVHRVARLRCQLLISAGLPQRDHSLLHGVGLHPAPRSSY